MKYCAFDLEVSTEIEGDWHKLRPLGISCAASFNEEGRRAIWYEHGDDMLKERIGQDLAKQMVYYLASQQVLEHRPIITWNGMGFDWQVILDESQCPNIISRIAPNHIDIGFAMMCDKGYMCGLNKAAQGMKVGSKLEGVKGKDAPVLWKTSLQDQQRVLEYVQEDARITGLVYEAITQMGYLQWITSKGKLARWDIPKSGLPTVREAMGLPVPDISWMTDPSRWERDNYTKWMLELMDAEGLL